MSVDSFNPVVSGLTQGYQLSQAIKQQQLEQDALTLQQQRFARQQQVEDLQSKLGILNSGGTPLNQQGGTTENVHTPGPTIAGVEVGGSDQSSNVPVTPGRTLSVGKQGYYIPTAVERMQQNAPIAQAQQNAETQAYAAKKNVDRQYDQVSIPGLTDQIDVRTLPYFNNQQNQQYENTRQDKSIKAQRDLQGAREAGENQRSAANNATTLQATRIREGGEDGTGGGATGNARLLNERAKQRFRAEADAVGTKKAAIDGQIDDVNAALTQEDGSTYKDARGNELEMNDQLRQQLTRKKKMLQSVSDAHAKRLKEIDDYVKPQAAGAQQQTTPNPGMGAPAAKNPYR